MELFGLHDKDGNEYKLVHEDNWGKIRISPITPESKFKIGDWVCVVDCKKSGAGTETVGCVGRIYHQYEDKSGYKVDFFDENGQWSYESCDIRLATKEEIENHLRKIAEEKYKDKKILSIYDMEGFFDINKAEYDQNIDEFHDRNLTLYRKGEWAKIIPEKKKLPKTIDEFKVALTDCYDFLAENNYRTVEKFLEDYED